MTLANGDSAYPEGLISLPILQSTQLVLVIHLNIYFQGNIIAEEGRIIML